MNPRSEPANPQWDHFNNHSNLNYNCEYKCMVYNQEMNISQVKQGMINTTWEKVKSF